MKITEQANKCVVNCKILKEKLGVKVRSCNDWQGEKIFLVDNPEYIGAYTGFYFQTYENKIQQAVFKIAEKLMDKKPKAEHCCGSTYYEGTFYGLKITVEKYKTPYNERNREIEIKFSPWQRRAKEVRSASV